MTRTCSAKALATVLALTTAAAVSLLASATPASADNFSGGLSPFALSGLADVNGDFVIDTADDSNAFFGDTSIINGKLDCDNWTGTNTGQAGDAAITTDDDCNLLAYDGTADGLPIPVTDGVFAIDDGDMPTIYPDPATPTNSSPTAAKFAWMTLGGKVDSNGNGSIDDNDCHIDLVGGIDVLSNTSGNANPCGFATPPSSADNGLVDLNGDSDITIADTCGDGCFFGHDITNGFVQDFNFPCDCTDFNLDDKTDIVWHNRKTGKNSVWYMNVGTYLGAAAINKTAPTSWKPFSTSDIDFDADPDLLWHNTSTAANSAWFMDGINYSSSTAINKTASLSWNAVTASDFDLDAAPDILWFQASTGKTSIWFMDGAEYLGSDLINKTAPSGWRPAGAADFDGDGDADILWHNDSTGKNSVWLIEEGNYEGSVAIAKTAATSWRPYAVRDFDGDFIPDILWHNISTGKNSIWLLDGTDYLGAVAINKTASLDWYPL
jgi:hypothetical protein